MVNGVVQLTVASDPYCQTTVTHLHLRIKNIFPVSYVESQGKLDFRHQYEFTLFRSAIAKPLCSNGDVTR